MSQSVANPLTLVMDIKSAEDYEQLASTLNKLQSLPDDQNPIVAALNRIATVHFARFVFLGTSQLAVITVYDDGFKEYIEAFVREIGNVFDQLLVHIKDAPPLPVSKHPDEFLDYVQRHDLKCIPPFYSAYPDLKVLDILTLQNGNKNIDD